MLRPHILLLTRSRPYASRSQLTLKSLQSSRSGLRRRPYLWCECFGAPTLPKELSFDVQAAHGRAASAILRAVTLALIVRQDETRQSNEHTAQMLAQSSPTVSLKSVVGQWYFGQFTTPRLKGNICRRVHMHRQESEPCPK